MPSLWPIKAGREREQSKRTCWTSKKHLYAVVEGSWSRVKEVAASGGATVWQGVYLKLFADVCLQSVSTTDLGHGVGE